MSTTSSQNPEQFLFGSWQQTIFHISIYKDIWFGLLLLLWVLTSFGGSVLVLFLGDVDWHFFSRSLKPRILEKQNLESHIAIWYHKILCVFTYCMCSTYSCKSLTMASFFMLTKNNWKYIITLYLFARNCSMWINITA